MADKEAIVVTGVSSGIGLATSQVLIQAGFHVFGTVRKEQDAERIASRLTHDFSPLVMDVTDSVAVEAAALVVGRFLRGKTLKGLVNNAGIALSGPLLYFPLDQLRYQFEVNIVALLMVTQAFAPLLGTDLARVGRPGRIVNMGSVGGRIGSPFLGPYAASKHALEGLSESMRRELMLFGVDVIIVAPGQVATPIWDKAEAEDYGRYERTQYASILKRFSEFFIAQGRKGLTAESIGEVVLAALTSKKPRFRYDPIPQRFKNWTLPTMLPKRVLDGIIAKRLGFRDLHQGPNSR